ncbi:MAG: hypothetical protein IT168_24880 [Bryobacterales bacterium]|nr:hypothetical protein [Bryobacterales bacterium]
MAHDFDVTLKQLIQESRGVLLSTLLGGPVDKWLNVELPKVENPRVDLLARLESGEHVHLELQSANDLRFAQRQAEWVVERA